MKFKAEIEIDLPDDIAKEWEPVALRRPVTGEFFYIHGNKNPVQLRKGFEMIGPFIILRRRFQWPAWLKCRYLTWDAAGNVSGWISKPTFEVGWCGGQSVFCAFSPSIDLPFPGGDWRTRVEENPNWKGDA